jgi:hypothetical protein
MKKKVYYIVVALGTVLLMSQCFLAKKESEVNKEGEVNKVETSTTSNATPERDNSINNDDENEDIFKLKVKRKLEGEYAKSFLVAYERFKTESLIPDEKKRVENYSVEFRENKNNIYVLFAAKLSPEESEIVGGESKLGKDVVYIIRKSDYQIVKRYFFK